MTTASPPRPASSDTAPAAAPTRRGVPVAVAVVAGVCALAAIAAVHLTQGTSEVGIADLLGLIGGGDDHTWNVLRGSRLPRLVAGLTVGLALGASGAALQSVARNHLASPDLLGVSAGAYLAVTATAAFGLTLPLWSSAAVAFVGGLLAAGLVLALSAGGTAGPTRLVLAGSATSLALGSATTLLLILFQQETTGLFGWGSGSLLAVDLDAARQMAPVLVVAVGGLVLLGRRLDVLALGDDTAAVLGIGVRTTRLWAVLAAVLLAAAAVTVAGPIGFVGLCAPVIVRLCAPIVPGVLRHRWLVVLSAVAGALVVLGGDVALRAVVGARRGVEIPTGVVTTLVGSVVLVALARRHRDAGPAASAPGAGAPAVRSRGRFLLVAGTGVVLLVGAVIAGTLLGDRILLGGDLLAHLQGRAGMRTGFILDQRLPRVGAAALAGAALALAGTTVQAVSRNPLAEPGILGITAGAGLGAVVAITVAPASGVAGMSLAAAIGAALAFGAVYGLAWRGGLNPDRLILVGIGVAAGLAALTTMVILASDPWNTPKALTWLSGSTYGRRWGHLVPVALALAVVAPLVASRHRSLDLLALDDDVPRVRGIVLERTRLGCLAGAVTLAAAAVTAVGVVGFVGLVAPHAARALVGGRHVRVLPVAALLGAVLVSVADTVGRTVIAPAQIPAGLITALVGTPYFVWLLWRSRGR